MRRARFSELRATIEKAAGDPAAVRKQKLLVEEGSEVSNFGDAVSLSADGRTALIGAPTNGSIPDAVYVFVKEADGGWSQQAKLEPSSGSMFFGMSVSLSADGDTALIGSPLEFNKGAAYIFTRDETGSWKQQSRFTSKDGVGNNISWHSFGMSVSLSADGQTALIGACEHPWMTSDISECKPGSAYIFVKGADGTWSQQVKLVPNERAKGDSFGSSVSLSADGQTALIGADGFYCLGHNSGMYYPGSAYIFTKGADGAWSSQQIKRTVVDRETGETYETSYKGKGFGCSVSLSGDGQTALVGKLFHQDHYRQVDVHLFTQGADGAWHQQATLTAYQIEENDDRFGGDVLLSADGRTALIGASGDDDRANNSGAAYVFVKNENGWWSQRTKLTAEDGAAGDSFGGSVALSADGQTALIGAPSDDDRGLNSGSAYVFSIPPPLPSP
jgi:hypothetical protein